MKALTIKEMKIHKLKKAKVPEGYLRITARSSVKEKGHFFIDAMIPARIGADLILFIEKIPKSLTPQSNKQVYLTRPSA